MNPAIATILSTNPNFIPSVASVSSSAVHSYLEDDYRLTGTAGSDEFKLVIAKKSTDFDHHLSEFVEWVTDKSKLVPTDVGTRTTSDSNVAKCMLKKMSICTTNDSAPNVACTAPSLPSSEAIRLVTNTASGTLSL